MPPTDRFSWDDSREDPDSNRCRHCNELDHVPGDPDTYCDVAQREYFAITHLGDLLGIDPDALSRIA